MLILAPSSTSASTIRVQRQTTVQPTRMTQAELARAKALDKAQNYITNVLEQDLINTINDILPNPSVNSNPDFLLYLTGYAQFFGTDYDPWCNNENWNILGRSSTPYLSLELRKAFNDHVSKVNTLYKNTIENKFASQARFLDFDLGFSGHRFCEPGATHDDQLNTNTTFDKVYVWNLNWPWQVANEPAPNSDEQNDTIITQVAEQLFGDDGVTAWSVGSGNGGGGNVPSNGWRLRPFHPRSSGYTSIKNAILAQLKADGLPKNSSSSSVSCYHAADPQNTCAAIANGPGWCECGDSPTTYAVIPTGQPCAWTTTPPTTSFNCAATPTPITPTACDIPAGCTNEAAPTGCAIACS